DEWELREHLPSRLRQQRRPPSSGRDGERRRANATSEGDPRSGERSKTLGLATQRSAATHLRYLRFPFSGIPLTTNSPTASPEKKVDRHSQIFTSKFVKF
ncbi:hypothetical protein, partial [Methanocorpusculum vombati]